MKYPVSDFGYIFILQFNQNIKLTHPTHSEHISDGVKCLIRLQANMVLLFAGLNLCLVSCIVLFKRDLSALRRLDPPEHCAHITAITVRFMKFYFYFCSVA